MLGRAKRVKKRRRLLHGGGNECAFHKVGGRQSGILGYDAGLFYAGVPDHRGDQLFPFLLALESAMSSGLAHPVRPRTGQIVKGGRARVGARSIRS